MIPWSEVQEKLHSCNQNYLDSKSLDEKKKLVKELGIIVSNNVAVTDELLDDLLTDVNSLYSTHEEMFKAIYSDTPLAPSVMSYVKQVHLDKVKLWYGDMIELQLDRTLRLEPESKKKALFEILPSPPRARDGPPP